MKVLASIVAAVLLIWCFDISLEKRKRADTKVPVISSRKSIPKISLEGSATTKIKGEGQ